MSAPPESAAERTDSRSGRALEIVRVLARDSRPAGGDAEARARGYCADRLRRAGFEVSEEAFEYSSFVGRWGTPLGGLVALGLLVGASASGGSGRGGLALVVLVLGGAGLATAAAWLARFGVLTFPTERRRGVNLIATRQRDASAATPAQGPMLWLMAHVDSKSQPVPILVRAAGITLLGLVWAAGIFVAASQVVLGIEPAPTVWSILGAMGVIGAIPVLATTVGSRSPGALDNATGVATVLAAAEDARVSNFGVCLTSAEELGLAGARAWVRGARVTGTGVAINCDGVDDGGRITCMYSGHRPDGLVTAVVEAGSRVGVSVRAHRLLPGVLTDGVALADAGWQVVTLSKGSARTLARIHTPRDRSDALNGLGMDEVARVIVELLESRT